MHETQKKQIQITLHEGQLNVFNNHSRFRIIQAGRRWGKSTLSCAIAISEMFQAHTVFFLTPTHDLNKTLFNEMLKWLPEQAVKAANKSELSIELINGGTAKWFSAESAGQMRGRKAHFLVIDEGSFISDLQDIYNSICLPLLIDYKGKVLAISTPNGHTFFDKLFLKGINKEPDYASFTFTSYENPLLDANEIETMRQNMPDRQFKIEILAQRIDSNDSNPFGEDNIVKNITPTLSTKPPVIFALDVAKVYDYSVLIGLDEDGTMCYFDRFRLNYELTVQRVKRIRSISEAKLIVDSTGVGNAVMEMIKKEVSNVEGFIFTGSSKPLIINKLILAIEQGKVKYTEQVANELYTYEMKIGINGNVTYNGAAGTHDDCVASLAMAYYHLIRVTHAANWKLYTI
ncbi:hypothetical protein DCC81_23960 [Chitinophaga parva]|uniref:Terminase large subunit gp17-like C-terminal domain-containing protein n=1 Tax=Chitinophaga parva TaxID=2169414 RepID=A0A2T7BEC7_9BACT|nr:terminase family protein [Chitinophaga parva]PUZ23437.1 hypothetical protein DCC81_23960 [Chitinophaga parva]